MKTPLDFFYYLELCECARNLTHLNFIEQIEHGWSLANIYFRFELNTSLKINFKYVKQAFSDVSIKKMMFLTIQWKTWIKTTYEFEPISDQGFV